MQQLTVSNGQRSIRRNICICGEMWKYEKSFPENAPKFTFLLKFRLKPLQCGNATIWWWRWCYLFRLHFIFHCFHFLKRFIVRTSVMFVVNGMMMFLEKNLLDCGHLDSEVIMIVISSWIVCIMHFMCSQIKHSGHNQKTSHPDDAIRRRKRGTFRAQSSWKKWEKEYTLDTAKVLSSLLGKQIMILWH